MPVFNSTVPLFGTGSQLKVSTGTGSLADPAVLKMAQYQQGSTYGAMPLEGTGSYLATFTGVGSIADPVVLAIDVAGSGGGVSNPMTSDLDAGGHSITNLGGLSNGSAGIPILVDGTLSVGGTIGDFSVQGTTSLDSNAITSDGAGNLTASGNFTSTSGYFITNSANIGPTVTTLDSGAIATNGSGVLTLNSVTFPSGGNIQDGGSGSIFINASGPDNVTISAANFSVDGSGNVTVPPSGVVSIGSSIVCTASTGTISANDLVGTLSGDGSNISNINASSLATGTVSASLLPLGQNTLTARVTGSDFTTTNGTLTNVTGLSIALQSNSTYEFEAHLSVNASAVTGNQYGVNYSTSGATVEAQIMGTLAANTMQCQRISAFNTASGTYDTAGADGGILIKGIVVTGANAGNLTIQTLAVVATSTTAKVYKQSVLTARQIA